MAVMRDEVLQLVLHSRLGLILGSVRKVVSNEQFLILLREVLELDQDKLRSYCMQRLQKQFICPFPRFSCNFNNGAIQRETCLPIFISCLHAFQLQALSAFSIPPQRNSTYPSSHSATELPAHRTEPLLYCQPCVKPPRITKVSLWWFIGVFLNSFFLVLVCVCTLTDVRAFLLM